MFMSFMDISTSLCFLLFVKLRFLHNLRLNIEKFETLWCPFCVKEWKNSSRYFKVVMKIFTSAGIKNILCQEGDVLEVLAKLFTLALGSINTNQYVVLRKCQASAFFGHLYWWQVVSALGRIECVSFQLNWEANSIR